MMKFQETLTNTRGDVLPGDRLQVVTSAGAAVNIYADDSATPFTDENGVPVNYATADLNGSVEFYWTPAAGQVLQWLDTGGNLRRAISGFAKPFLLGEFGGVLAQSQVTNLVADLTAKTAVADLASTASGKGAGLVGNTAGGTVQQQMLADTTALAALTPTNGQTARISTDGEWKFDNSNLSAEVAANSYGGLYKAPASAPTGATGAWIRRLPDEPRSSYFGINHNDSADNASWLSDINEFYTLRGGGRLLWQEGIALAGAPLVMPDNLHIVGMGPTSAIRNTAVSASSNLKSPLYLGYWHPEFNGYSAVSGGPYTRGIDRYRANAVVTEQAMQVTLATAADAAAFTVGQIAYLRSDETREQLIGATYYEIPLQNSLVKILSADSGSGVVTFQKPAGFTSATAPWLCELKVGAGNAFGDAQFVQGVRVENIGMYAADGCAFGNNNTGAYDCHFRNIWGDVKNIVQANAVSWCSFFGFRGRFKEVAAEVKFTAHNFTFGDWIATTSAAAASATGVFNFGEGARKIRGSNLMIDAPGRTGSPGILVQDCTDVELLSLMLRMRDSTGNGVQFSSHSWAAAERFILNNFLLEHGGANHIAVIASSTYEPRSAKISRGRMRSTNGAFSAAIAWNGGQANEVSHVDFDKGNFQFAGNARGNKTVGCTIPQQATPTSGSAVALRNYVTDCRMIDHTTTAAATATTGAAKDVPETFLTKLVNYNPGSIASGASDTAQTETITGAELGDRVTIQSSIDMQGLEFTTWVSAADTVKYQLHNRTGGAVDLAAMVLRIRVVK